MGKPIRQKPNREKSQGAELASSEVNGFKKTMIMLTEQHNEKLRVMSFETRLSRSEIVRNALDAYL